MVRKLSLILAIVITLLSFSSSITAEQRMAIEEAKRQYNYALDYLFKEKMAYNDVIMVLEGIMSQVNDKAIVSDCLYLTALAKIKLKKWDEAYDIFNKIKYLYPECSQYKNVIVWTKKIYFAKGQYLIEQKDYFNAKVAFKKVIDNFPRTSFAKEAQAQIQIIDQILKSHKIVEHVPENSYSGLIIDASNLNLRRSMAPKVYDEYGNEIYGTIKGDISELVMDHGIVLYSPTLERARQLSGRVGASPLVITAVSSKGVKNSDVIISNSDAKIISNALNDYNFFNSMRVVLVIGE